MTKSKLTKVVKKEVKEKKTKVAKKTKGAYTLEVKVDDVKYKGSADSLVEALSDFVASKDYPLGAKTMAVFNVINGDKTYSEIWRVTRARKMFTLMSLKPTTIELIARKMEAALA